MTMALSKRFLSRLLRDPFAISRGTFSSSGTVCDAKSKSVGIVGMGNVGKAVINNLMRDGYKVTAINDIDSTRCSGYPDTVAVAKCPREVAEMSDVIVSGLPKPPHVKAAFEGSDGICAGLQPGKIWVDHSTTDFNQNYEFSKKAAAKGAQILEAPITGGLEALKKGQMAVWVAGDENAFNQVKPILQSSYSTVMYTGGLGTAMMPKVVSNMLCCIQVIALGEVMMVAKKSGMDLTKFWHHIRGSAGNSFLWETCGPNVFRGDFHDSFALDLQVKDIRLFVDMAKSANVPTELMDHMHEIYQRALDTYGPDVGCYTPPRLLEDKVGTKLRSPGFDKWTYDVENTDGALHIRHKGIKLE